MITEHQISLCSFIRSLHVKKYESSARVWINFFSINLRRVQVAPRRVRTQIHRNKLSTLCAGIRSVGDVEQAPVVSIQFCQLPQPKRLSNPSWPDRAHSINGRLERRDRLQRLLAQHRAALRLHVSKEIQRPRHQRLRAGGQDYQREHEHDSSNFTVPYKMFPRPKW